MRRYTGPMSNDLFTFGKVFSNAGKGFTSVGKGFFKNENLFISAIEVFCKTGKVFSSIDKGFTISTKAFINARKAFIGVGKDVISTGKVFASPSSGAAAARRYVYRKPSLPSVKPQSGGTVVRAPMPPRCGSDRLHSHFYKHGAATRLLRHLGLPTLRRPFRFANFPTRPYDTAFAANTLSGVIGKSRTRRPVAWATALATAAATPTIEISPMPFTPIALM